MIEWPAETIINIGYLEIEGRVRPEKTSCMERRKFIRNTMLSAVAVSAHGYVQFNGLQFEGDCATTTDILGPFYRPEAPIRSNMLVKGSKGQLVTVMGQVKHKDCKTPLKNACVELWHCDEKGVYDNESEAFNYRARTFCDDKGNYEFKTIIPVPYDVGNGHFRPAHYHMLISADGYQALITQLYFTGDKYLADDSSAKSPAAKSRILDIKNGSGGVKMVSFDVTMLEKVPADESVLNRLSGDYTRSDNGKVETFYKKAGLLWIKDTESINGGYPMEYLGNNSFGGYGSSHKLTFTPTKEGPVQLAYSGNRSSWSAVKK
jgi:protocatechuate 3,4-dioxygenase beta subunit